MNRYCLLLALYVGLPVSVGCQPSTNALSGIVKYEDTPVAHGYITFNPADGHGAVLGEPINDGHYAIHNLPLGKMTVGIVGVKSIHFATTHAEMAEAAKHPGAQPEKADDVPANAIGNNQTIEIEPGSHEMNFDLKRPAS